MPSGLPSGWLSGLLGRLLEGWWDVHAPQGSADRRRFRYSTRTLGTDVPGEMARLADYAAGLGVVERVEVLPFHQMGAYKWARLGLDYTLDAAQPPSAEQVEAAVNIFRAAGLNAS